MNTPVKTIVQPIFHPSHLEIQFDGPVTTRSIHDLRNLLHTFTRNPDTDLQGIFNHYNYNRVILKITSPGGEVNALLLFFHTLENIRAAFRATGEQFILETRAEITCASAAALMLSFGTPGYRGTTCPDTHILYHDCAAHLNDQGRDTEDKYRQVQTSLRLMNNKVALRLLRHLHPEIDSQVFSRLEDYCCRIYDHAFDRDRLRVFLRDIDSLHTSAPAADSPEKKDFDRLDPEDLRGQIERQIKQIASEAGKDSNPAPLDGQAGATLSLRRQMGIILVKMKHLQDVFREDCPLPHEKAISLGLYDYCNQSERQSIQENSCGAMLRQRGTEAHHHGVINFKAIPEINRCRHMVAFGQTGSGKTESVIKPALYSYILSNRESVKTPALVIDPKGDMVDAIYRQLAATKEKPMDLNESNAQLWLFDRRDTSQMSPCDIVEEILVVSSKYDQYMNGRDPFWVGAASRLLETVVAVDRFIFKATGSSQRINKFYTEFFNYLYRLKCHNAREGGEKKIILSGEAQLNDFGEKHNVDPFLRNLRNPKHLAELSYLHRLLNILKVINSHVNQMDALRDKAINISEIARDSTFFWGWKVFEKYFNSTWNVHSEKFTREWETAVSYLGSWAYYPSDTYNSVQFTLEVALNSLLNPTVSRLICFDPFQRPARRIDAELLIRRGQVTLYRPQADGEAGEMFTRLLKKQMFTSLIDDRRKNNPNIPVFYYLCDEFQKFISLDEYSGEQDLLEICRAYRVSCIFATQSMASLYGICGNDDNKRFAVKQMLQNICSKFFFSSQDPDTTDYLLNIIPSQADRPHPISIRPLKDLAPGETRFILAGGECSQTKIKRFEEPLDVSLNCIHDAKPEPPAANPRKIKGRIATI